MRSSLNESHNSYVSTHFTSCIEKRERTTGALQTEALQCTPEANGRATPKIAPGSAGMPRWRIPQRHPKLLCSWDNVNKLSQLYKTLFTKKLNPFASNFIEINCKAICWCNILKSMEKKKSSLKHVDNVWRWK